VLISQASREGGTAYAHGPASMFPDTGAGYNRLSVGKNVVPQDSYDHLGVTKRSSHAPSSTTDTGFDSYSHLVKTVEGFYEDPDREASTDLGGEETYNHLNDDRNAVPAVLSTPDNPYDVIEPKQVLV
jgi:hypothetical protein